MNFFHDLMIGCRLLAERGIIDADGHRAAGLRPLPGSRP
jgi:hypothetical protein